MKYNEILNIGCCTNMDYIVKNLLDTIDPKQIDILHDEGSLFKIAISNNNLKIIDELLSFFEKQNPTQEQREKLASILEEQYPRPDDAILNSFRYHNIEISSDKYSEDVSDDWSRTSIEDITIKLIDLCHVGGSD